MQARIFVTLKNGVLDPQGKAIQTALHSLGHDNVNGVRQGKLFEVSVDADNRSDAETQLAEMCEKLLANTVIENYAIEIVD